MVQKKSLAAPYLVWMAAIYLLLHLIADLLMGVLDPRAKLEGMR